jgi:hypothetical protein
MDPDVRKLLVEFVEKSALLRRDMQHKGELEAYAARFARMEQKLTALAAQVEQTDPDLARALRAAWSLPARTLAFRNADHQKRDRD